MLPLVEKKSKSGFFRIHESGDFYSQEYVDKWFEICRALPEVTFLAFTKSFHLAFDKAPKNLVLIWSIWPDTDLSAVPPGPRAYAGEFKRRRKTLECPGNCDMCGMCWDIHTVNADVHFEVH